MTALATAALAAIVQLGAYEALRNPAPATLWLEAVGGAEHCDWYLSGRDILRMPDAERRTTLDGCEVTLRLRGTLNPASARYFDELTVALTGTTARPAEIILDSRGGEADAAFHIAGRIREHSLYRRRTPGVATSIADDDGSVCFSACLFVFAAGFERRAEFEIYGDPRLASRMGIHRPAQLRRRDGSFDSDADNVEIRRVEQIMRHYFSRVGVDPKIVDHMFDIPFDEIHLLTREEAQAYGLLGANPD